MAVTTTSNVIIPEVLAAMIAAEIPGQLSLAGSGAVTVLDNLKGGPGNTKSDLFVINKTDLAPHVGANLDVMRADTERMRPNRPYAMTNLKTLDGLDSVVRFIETKGLLQAV